MWEDWYVRVGDGWYFIVTTPSFGSYTTPPLTTTQQYKAVVFYGFYLPSAKTSDIAAITVLAPANIVTQPQSQGINPGMTATLSVNAIGPSPQTYQWYAGTSGNTSSPIGGATASSYTTPPLSSTTNFWVRVSNPYGPADSNTATITVGVSPGITTHPQSQVIASGSTATLSVAATGPTLTYQWYVGTSGNTASPIAGATASSYTTPPLITATNYWVRVSNPFGTANSATAAITIGAAPSITTHPPSQAVCSGAILTIHVDVTGTPPLSYQWYAGMSGDTSSPAWLGHDYTMPPLTVTASYWVRVSNPYGTVDSNTATFTIHPLSVTTGSKAFGPAGGSGSAAVTIDASCSWNGSTSASWIAFGVDAGQGDGTMTFTAAPNSTGVSRSASITLRSGVHPGGDQTVLVTELITSGDFDSDGKADVAVFRPSTGGWYVLRSSTGNTTSFGVSWGLSTDEPVPGDYDGDGTTDPAVFRPSTGGWYILTSSTHYATSTRVLWGLSTDVPVRGDYDGDGKTDPAIYRPSTGLWAILKSSVGYGSGMYVSWGLSTDQPMPGDYDGDGKIDPAVYRPSTGGWYVLKSSTNFTTSFGVLWGLSTDVPVPGDYDGDGKVDPAIFRPSTGLWAMLKSSASYGSAMYLTLGDSSDLPAPADYDGDGKTDPATFRPSTGEWSVLKSSTDYAPVFSVSWGLSTDMPMNKRP